LLTAATRPVFTSVTQGEHIIRYPNVYDQLAEARKSSAFVGGTKVCIDLWALSLLALQSRANLPQSAVGDYSQACSEINKSFCFSPQNIQHTMPNTALYRTIPNTTPDRTIPNTAPDRTIPNIAQDHTKYRTGPDHTKYRTVWRRDIPSTALYRTIPNTALYGTVTYHTKYRTIPNQIPHRTIP